MESVIQKEKKCFVCETTIGLECHHCLHGTANRKLAEQYGLKVWLCNEHHTGSMHSVHRNKELDDHLKKVAQRTFERVHGSRNDFRAIFGKSYL